jgi:4-amino-4-deoxy-L-arabinose transferase-like glycosyltransferase
MHRPAHMTPASGGRTAPRVALATVLAFALAFRVAGLAHFPIVEADEGLWTRSAKNFLVFGDWFMDEHTHLLLSPVFHALELVAFAAAGPSIEVARLLSAIAGTASVLLVYVLVQRATARRDVALTTAIVFAFCQWTVVISRKALIEPVQLCAVLASACFLVRDGWKNALAAGVLMGVALLTKVNAAFIALVFGLYLLLPLAEASGRAAWRVYVGRAAVFAMSAVIVAGSVLGALARAYPDRFRAAYLYELDGVHFESLSNPIIRVGRFGLDPVQAARTIVELVREEPLLMVYCLLGMVVAFVARRRHSGLFMLWLGIGMPFLLGQMFQPLRYFVLLTPAFAFFAALFVCWLAEFEPLSTGARKIAVGALGLYVAFDVAYVGMNAVASREVRIDAVVQWASTSSRSSDRILASALFCTDLPNPALGYYKLVKDRSDLLPALKRHRIDYVIVDSAEWPAALADEMALHFRPIARWPFATVYRVSEPVDSNPIRAERSAARDAVLPGPEPI